MALFEFMGDTINGGADMGMSANNFNPNNGYVPMPPSGAMSATDMQVINAVSQIAANSNQMTMNAINNLKAAEEEKHMYKMSMEKMKRERQGKPDEFTITDGDLGICINSKGVHIQVGRIKITAVSGNKILTEDGVKNVLVVDYTDSNNNKRKTVITENNLTEKKLVGCFPGFEFICSNSKTANNFLAWHINTFFNGKYTNVIPNYAGFTFYKENETEKACFYCNDNSMSPELLSSCSDNIRNNILPRKKKTIEELVNYVKKYIDTPEKCLLFTISLCGTLSSILNDIGCSVKQIFTIAPQNSYVTRQACIYLKTFNRGQTPLSFDSNKTKIRKTFHNSKDEVIVINDCSIISDSKRRENMLQYTLELNSDNETQPHCTAIFSNFAAHLIRNNQNITIKLDGDFYTEMTQEEENEMCDALNCITSYIISIVCEQYSQFKETLKNCFDTAFNDIGAEIPDIQSRTSYAVMAAISSIVSTQLNCDYILEKTSDILLDIFTDTAVQPVDDSDDIIANDFAACLSNAVRSREISVILHCKEMNFVSGEPQVIVKENLLMIEESTINDVILSKMKTADNVHDIIKALDNVGLLHATKKNRFPLTVYNHGKSLRITFIAMDIEGIFDSGLILKIRENKYKEWFSSEAANDKLFPVLTNRLGEKAYQRFEFEKSDNMHCFYLGQSGSGKTNGLTERMCSLFKIGQKVVILDTSDSFTRNAVINNLSAGGDDYAQKQAEKFVEENITFHKVEELGVPVDILKLQYPAIPETKRKIIDSILSAHISNMGKVQKATLRNGITDLMAANKLNMTDMYERLTDETVSDSLAMQFEDMLSCFLEYKVSEKSWDEFLNDSKGIVVISTDSFSGSGGSGLVDMLLMSLFYNQRNNPEQHIAVFIDEIQNQNFSPNSAITQILKEGRKYHINLNYATQFLPSGNKDIVKVMSLASLRVFLQPDDISAKTVSKTIGIPALELTSMNQGECYISGTIYNNKEDSTKNGTIHGYTYRNFVPLKEIF